MGARGTGTKVKHEGRAEETGRGTWMEAECGSDAFSILGFGVLRFDLVTAVHVRGSRWTKKPDSMSPLTGDIHHKSSELFGVCWEPS
jgi:hypothetical protein